MNILIFFVIALIIMPLLIRGYIKEHNNFSKKMFSGYIAVSGGVMAGCILNRTNNPILGMIAFMVFIGLPLIIIAEDE